MSEPLKQLPSPTWLGDSMVVKLQDVLTPDMAARLSESVRMAGYETDAPGRDITACSRARQAAQAEITAALMDHSGFLSSVLPHSVTPPSFEISSDGDRLTRQMSKVPQCHPETGAPFRPDMAAMLFLSDPADYEGGELQLSGRFAQAGYRLPAGHMLIFAPGSFRRMAPVVSGNRLACFFWMQSLVGDSAARRTLYELDRAIQSLTAERGRKDDQVGRLTAIYHQLIRRWAEA
ncbi:PKHD-type hydroxylase [Altericroceibacterium spongiae]|uniref:PKHD-type hydroxylase n=1 Tax=Altericroceibacterium spongiae TaxID=2320269 RepID=A0A420EPH0_9SPHN|nr:PKHD-type hydroxylase [Altericroceibacterium spongiae]RKF22573.1 PKHD-type hydroxylase [Altericroceibacterium spongiae]